MSDFWVAVFYSFNVSQNSPTHFTITNCSDQPNSLQVGNIGAGTLIWKKDTRLISAGALIIRKDPRLRLEGYNLTLSGVRPEDEGEYICEVETFNLEPIQQASKLSVLIPARVEPLPHSGSQLDMYIGPVRSSRSGNLCLSVCHFGYITV